MKLTISLAAGALAMLSAPSIGITQVQIPAATPQNRGDGSFQVDPNNGQTYAIGGGVYKDITGNATTVVKTGAGFLHSVTLNTLAASETLSIYDNITGNGTLIANITGPSTITGVDPITLTYDSAFTTGLTVVTAGGAATNVTVSYH